MNNTKLICSTSIISTGILESMALWFVFVFSLSVNCGSDKLEMWSIQWYFKNEIDSTNISQIPRFSIDVNHYLNSALIDNEYFDIDSSCLRAQISMAGSKEYVDEFPNSATLSVILCWETDTVFDTVFNFNELDFDNNNVNYQTFYISVPVLFKNSSITKAP